MKKRRIKPINYDLLRINYKTLRRLNPEAARMAVLEFLNSFKNITLTAKAFGISRSVVYDIIQRNKREDLKDKSKRPSVIKNKTPHGIEEKVIEARNLTGLGPLRLSIHLRVKHNIILPYGTIRNILRRNKEAGG